MLLLAAVWSLPHVVIEPDLSRMLPTDSPHVRLSAMLDDSGESRRSLFLLVRPPGDTDSLTDDRLERLIDDLRRSPYLASVSATREELFGAALAARARAPLRHLPIDTIEKLITLLSPEGRRAALEATLQNLAEDPIGGREVAVRDPLGVRFLLAESRPKLPFELDDSSVFARLANGKGALLRLIGKEPSLDARFATELMDDVDARIGRAGLPFDAFGGYAIARADAARIRGDLVASIVGSAILVFLYLTLSFRSHRLAACIVLPVAGAAFCALGLGGVVFGPLSPVAIASAAVLLGLGVDFAIHYVVRYVSLRSQLGAVESQARTTAAIGAPLLVGMLTTTVAFVSLAAGDFGGLAGFGLLLALGLSLAFLATRFLVPILLEIGPPLAPHPSASRSVISAALQRLATGPFGSSTAAALLVVTVAAVVFVATVGVNLSVAPEHLRPDNDTVTETRTRLERELGVSLVPVFLLTTPEPDTGTSARSTAGVRTLLAEKRILFTTAPTVGAHTRTTALARFHTETDGWLAGTRQDLDALGFDPAPFEPALAELAKLLKRTKAAAAAEPVTLPGLGERVPYLCYLPAGLDADGRDALRSRVGELLGPGATIYGTDTLLTELRAVLTRDLALVLSLTAVLAFGLVLWMARSLTAGLLCLLPTVCGFSITAAVLSLLDVPISLGNFVAVPFLLGIAVDDGVHLVAHLRRTGGADPGTTGVAISRTTVTTILAFGSLAFAASPGLASLGWIVALGVSCCLVTSLLLLPPLWRRFS